MEPIITDLKREAEELRRRVYLEKYGDLKHVESNKKLDLDDLN